MSEAEKLQEQPLFRAKWREDTKIVELGLAALREAEAIYRKELIR